MGKRCEIKECHDTRPAIGLNGHYFCPRHFEGALAYMGIRGREVVETVVRRLESINKEKTYHG
jgi:hypothetical protein